MNETVLYIFLAIPIIELFVVVICGGKLAAQIGKDLRKKIQPQNESNDNKERES